MLLDETLFSQPVKTKLNESLSIIDYHDLSFLLIQHASARAIISLQGGQLLFWQPVNEKPVIWLSEKTFFKADTAIRGGVPICWPWFGPVNKPSHGFARIQSWHVHSHHESIEEISVSLILRDNDATRALWNHPFTLIETFTFNKQCKIELAIETDTETTAALHSYFTIGDIHQTAVTGLGNSYIDKVDNSTIKSGDGKLTVAQEVDHIYTNAEHSSIIDDPMNQRKICLHHHQASDVVAWNPWQALSEKMADMPNDGYKTMICVETARIHQSLAAKSQLGVTFEVKK